MPIMPKEEWENHMLHIIIKQNALKTGLRKFKEQGEAAVTKELTQLYTL